MKKKQMLALALASAMAVPTVAHITTSAVYAEETVEQLRKDLAESVEKLKAANLATGLENYDTVEKIENEGLKKDELKSLIAVVNDLKVLLTKELGAYKTTKENVIKALEALSKDSYGMESILKEGNDAIIKDSINEYRTSTEKAIAENEGKKVKEAEEALEAAKVAFSKVADDDYAEKAKKAAAVADAQKALLKAKEDLLKKENELAEKINNVESYVKLNDAVESVKVRAEKAIAEFKTSVDLRKAKEAFEKASDDMAKYGTQEQLDAATKKAEDALKAIKDKIEEKLSVNTDQEITIDKVDKYLEENHSDLSQKEIVLIEELVSKSDLDTYAEAKKEKEAIPTQVKDNVDAEKTAYNNAYKEEKAAKEDLEKAKKDAEKKIALVGIALDAQFSNDFFDKYESQEAAVEVLKKQLKAHEGSAKDAKAEVTEIEEKIAKKEKEIKESPENIVLESELKALKSELEVAEKKLSKANSDIEEVKGHLAKLEAKSKELFEAYRKYNQAVKNGATENEMNILKQELARILESYNTYARDNNLPLIGIGGADLTNVSWVKINGVWYYKDAAGKDAYKNAWGKIDGVWYRFDKNGAMLANKWFQDADGKWFWLEESGAMSENEWVYVNGSWFYAKSGGYIAEAEWVYVNGSWFYAKSGGYIAEAEWVYVDGKWYYAKSGGYVAQSESVKVDGTVYSFDSSCAWVK